MVWSFSYIPFGGNQYGSPSSPSLRIYSIYSLAYSSLVRIACFMFHITMVVSPKLFFSKTNKRKKEKKKRENSARQNVITCSIETWFVPSSSRSLAPIMLGSARNIGSLTKKTRKKQKFECFMLVSRQYVWIFELSYTKHPGNILLSVPLKWTEKIPINYSWNHLQRASHVRLDWTTQILHLKVVEGANVNPLSSPKVSLRSTFTTLHSQDPIRKWWYTFGDQ